MVRQRKGAGVKKTRPSKIPSSGPRPLSITPAEAGSSAPQKTVLPDSIEAIREQIRLMNEKLDALSPGASDRPDPPEEPEQPEGGSEGEAEEPLARNWRDGARLALAFIQDVMLGFVPYGYGTVDSVGPLVFWLLLVPLTVIGGGFALKTVEFGSFMMRANAVRHPCNSTDLLASMEEFGLRERYCGTDVHDPRVSWWDMGSANFCALGGTQVVEMTAGWELPLPEEYKITEDGMLGIRVPRFNQSAVVETDSLLWGMWQASVHGQPVRFHVCGPGYAFWDVNHLMLGMIGGFAVMFLCFALKWVQGRVYPLLGIAVDEREGGDARASIAGRVGSFVFYAILFGYVGKALVMWNFWIADCSPYIEHRSSKLAIREIASALSPASYFTAGDTLMQELGFDEVDFENCDAAHLLAYSRFKPDQANFYNLASAAHFWYAFITYTQFKVYKFIALVVWRRVIRPAGVKLIARCRRVRARLAARR